MTTTETSERAACGSCRFRSANPFINPDRGAAEFGDIMYACKRRAPVATGGLHCPTMTIWPMVSTKDWCGDHLPRTLEEKSREAK